MHAGNHLPNIPLNWRFCVGVCNPCTGKQLQGLKDKYLDSLVMMFGGYGNDQFHFISVEGPGVLNDKITRRLARSHAVKQALKNKRRLQQRSRENFRITTDTTKTKQKALTHVPKNHGTVVLSPFSLAAGALDPFQSLAVDSTRLQKLLQNCKLTLLNWIGQVITRYFR